MEIEKPKIFEVENAVPPTDSTKGFYTLPTNVTLKQLITHITFSNKKPLPQVQLNSILLSIHNEAIISDCFWLFFCKEFKSDTASTNPYNDIAEGCLDRIAANFVSFFIDYSATQLTNKKKKEKFFKVYYDIVAQAVFFAFYFAYPKSRPKFTTITISRMLAYFSRLFNGIETKKSNIEHWVLELGSGNIISELIARSKKSGLLPSKGDTSTKKKGIRYSELFQRYLERHKYKMINCIKPLNMKISQPQEVKEKREYKFKSFKTAADKCTQAVVESKKKCSDEELECKSAIETIKYVDKIGKQLMNRRRS